MDEALAGMMDVEVQPGGLAARLSARISIEGRYRRWDI